MDGDQLFAAPVVAYAHLVPVGSCLFRWPPGRASIFTRAESSTVVYLSALVRGVNFSLDRPLSPRYRSLFAQISEPLRARGSDNCPQPRCVLGSACPREARFYGLASDCLHNFKSPDEVLFRERQTSDLNKCYECGAHYATAGACCVRQLEAPDRREDHCQRHRIQQHIDRKGQRHREGRELKGLLKVEVSPVPASDPAARAALEDMTEKWGKKYAAIIRLWESAWEEFTPFLDYDLEIRTVICSTNPIESLNARYRRAVRARGHFPTEQAALKCLYLVTRSLDPTGRGRTRWTMRWKPALNAFDITFADRWPAAETY